MTRIKICGITNRDDALLCVALGADALGFIFADSPRQIAPGAARDIIGCLPPGVAAVGVFVNERPKTVEEIFHCCRLSAVQLHGEEDPAYIASLSVPAIKTFRVKDDQILEDIRLFRPGHFLLDTFDHHAAGGTGRSFNWDIARKAAQYGQVILSGGLNHENIADALQVVHPYAVDVSSGVERAVGRKDGARLEKFISEVHGWDNRTNAGISEHTAGASFLRR